MDFQLQPTLTAGLVELRPLQPGDFDDLFAAAADPLIWEQHPESDRYTEEKFRRYFEGAMQSGGAFAVVDRRTGRMIGSTRYHGYDPVAGGIEVGWTFREPAPARLTAARASYSRSPLARWSGIGSMKKPVRAKFELAFAG